MGLFKYSCRVLEINIISAQDLAPVAKNMKTYAVAWINTDPMRKLTTRVDQTNRANPIWNEKFVFRVDDKILNVEASAIVIDVYTAAWAKDALVGTVNVLLSDLFAPWSGFDDGDGTGNNNMRLVTLQIRRPSGRLQGFLRLGVALLDGTQRSMPLSVEVFDGSHRGRDGYPEMPKENTQVGGRTGGGMLRRTRSDQTDFTTLTDDCGARIGQTTGGRASNGGGGGGTDSMVNGSLCNSDVGPSASVVAAAIAQGLYHRQRPPANKDDASSILEGTTEGVKHKLERWRSEMTPNYENRRYKKTGPSVYNGGHKGDITVETDSSSGRRGSRKGGGRRRRGKQRRKDNSNVNGDSDGRRKKGLFSCFGTVFGCEISITCGGGDHSSKKRYSNNKVANLSAVDETFSQSVV